MTGKEKCGDCLLFAAGYMWGGIWIHNCKPNGLPITRETPACISFKPKYEKKEAPE